LLISILSCSQMKINNRNREKEGKLF